jgi:hypothetical protein
MSDDTEIAVLIPCFKEQEAIGAVVSAFKAHVPEAASFVYDTASRLDGSHFERARSAAPGS